MSTNQPAKLEKIKVERYVPVDPGDNLPVEFQLSDEVTIDVYQIVSIVAQGKMKGKSTKLNFGKATIMKVLQLLENTFEGIRDKVNAEIEAKEESSASEASKENQEEQKDEPKEGVQKKPQPIVRAKRPPVQVQPSVQDGPKPKRSASRQASAKIAKYAEQMLSDDEELEKSEIGQKRAAPFQETSSKVVKRKVRKLSDGSEQLIVKVTNKPKKLPKKPTVFKTGKWNPETELLNKEDEIEHFGSSKSAIFTCCLRCNNRNVIRAIENDDVNLLRALILDQKNIPSFTDTWSIDSNHLQPLRMILEKKNMDLLETLFKNPSIDATDSIKMTQNLFDLYVRGRAKVKPYLLRKVDTGSVSDQAYGIAVRQVQQTRGNRQGNQAFYFDTMPVSVPTLLHTLRDLKQLTPDFIKAFQLLTGNNKPESYVSQLTSLAKVGNRDFLIWLIEPLIKLENYGFNELHLDVLKLDQLTVKYHTASVIKKASSAGDITPMHLACINPNKNVLSSLIEQNNNINVMDDQNYKPIHYAAACSDPGPMQVLLQNSANLFDFTKHRETALHIAAINGNAQIIKLILETNLDVFKCRDGQNKTAMTYACELGQIEPIKAFLDFSAGKIKVNTRHGYDRMTLLMYAASQGNYELAEFLLERKARVVAKDKFQRTALIMAVRNGHTRLASLLLQRGSEWNHVDSSNNTPLHYAAASGFIECIDLLIKHGANVHALNSWKVTPIAIAMLNNHNGTVMRLLKEPNVDVNGKDDSGKTLLIMNMMDLSDPSCVEFTKFLLEKGADPNLTDVQGNSPLLLLTQHIFGVKKQYYTQEQIKENEERRKIAISMIDLLITFGADINIKDKQGKTILMMNMVDISDVQCVDFATYLIGKGADPNMSDTQGNSLLLQLGAHFTKVQNNSYGSVPNKNQDRKTLTSLIELLFQNGVDVNSRDREGKTLLMMSLVDLSVPECLDFTKYLLDKGADPNLQDSQGNTVLHQLADYNVGNLQKDYWQRNTSQEKTLLISLVDLVMNYGAQSDTVNKSGENAFAIALRKDNVDILNKISANVKISQFPHLLHQLKTKVFDDRYKNILADLISKEEQTTALMNTLDKRGVSLFLAYIEQYIEQLRSQIFSNRIREAILWNSWKHKTDYSSYQMTNAIVFATNFKEDQEYVNATQGYSYQNRFVQQVPGNKLQELNEQYMESLITVPFISFLKFLVSKGADPHAKVDRLQFYRELDELKLKLAHEEEAIRNGKVDEVMQIDTVQKKQEDINNKKIHRKKLGQRKLVTKLSLTEKGIYKFYTSQNQVPTFEVKDGVKVEIDYDKELYLQNSVHFLIRHPQNTLFDYLVKELETPIDETDHQGRTPFLMNVLARPNQTTQCEIVRYLLESNVKTELTDSRGRTPFLIFYEHHNIAMADLMLQKGADINHSDNQGLFALQHAFIRRKNEEIERLVDLGADINQVDSHGRNLLHHAVNISSATADASFETEQLLIDLGININQRDNKMRVPLHYAFVKIKDWNNSSMIDPIEQVSSLCSEATLEIDVPDKWNKTPLHYAAQRSSAISTLYILNRGANLEAKDIYGNTPLGISLLRKHFTYGILLIQKKANVNMPVYNEFPRRVEKLWFDEANDERLRLQSLQEIQEKQLEPVTAINDVEMASESEEYGEEESKSQKEDINSDDDEEIKDEQVDTGRDLFNLGRQNAIAKHQLMILDQNKRQAELEEEIAIRWIQNYNNQKAQTKTVIQAITVQNYNTNVPVEPVTPPKWTFRLAIENQQQGLAYLIIDNGFDYMLATQDALDDRKFNLVLTLFSKISDNRILQQKNENQQNLMHVLAKNSSGGQFKILKRIYDKLNKRGVNCLERDSFGSNSLHYAVQQGCFDLCKILVQEGVSINEVNSDGHTPLSLHMRGREGSNRVLRPKSQAQPDASFEQNSMFHLLAKNGADVNYLYPDSSFNSKDNYQSTIVISIIRQSTIGDEQMKLNLKCLFDYGAKLTVNDSTGQGPLMYAIKKNNLDLVRFILEYAEKGLVLNQIDDCGMDGVMHAIQLQNIPLVEILLKHNDKGFTLSSVETHGKDGLVRAIQNNNLKMFQLLLKNAIKPFVLAVMSTHGRELLLQAIQSNRLPMTLLLLKNMDESFLIGEVCNHAKEGLMHSIKHQNVDMLKLLLENADKGFQLNVVDSDGRDGVMNAILLNNLKIVELLLQYKDNGLIANHLDKEGKNAIHYVVSSANYGSFENASMLSFLISNDFFDLNQKDIHGKTPLDYALLQESGTMAKVLRSKLGQSIDEEVAHPVNYLNESDWPQRLFDFDQDSRQLLEKAEADKDEEMEDQRWKIQVPLDEEFEKDIQYKAFCDGVQHRPYLANLQKVDLKNGPQGQYVFYRLQLIHDTNRDLYIVVTRWGLIGESGMHQRSPFNSVDEAKKEFEKIFKQKTGNDWSTAETSFVKQPKKYNLIKVCYSYISYRDCLAPFDYEKCAEAAIDKKKRNMIEEIANYTMYQRAYSSLGIDGDRMPISKMSKETLFQANEILKSLKVLITDFQAEVSKQNDGNYELIQELRTKISDESSKYFELIPLAENRYKMVLPIDNLRMFDLHYSKIEALTSIEYSSRVLLGALYRQMQVNPVDYVYDCLQTRITPMSKRDPEYELIAQYIQKTCSSGSVSNFKQFKLFKLERKGEGERFEPFRNLKNRRLLFHGSAMTNMIGILSQGLRIAPPEAPTTGYMFGKGVYFADTFKKSAHYTSGYQTRLMLMCEVALGEILDLYKPQYVDNLPSQFNSVRGCGATGPDFDSNNKITTPDGFQVPVSNIISYPYPTEEALKKSSEVFPSQVPQTNQVANVLNGLGNQTLQQHFYWQLQQNEYIVYNVNQVRIRYMIQFQM